MEYFTNEARRNGGTRCKARRLFGWMAKLEECVHKPKYALCRMAKLDDCVLKPKYSLGSICVGEDGIVILDHTIR
jgi:hypothetical protein